MEIMDVTLDNLAQEHICCALSEDVYKRQACPGQ